jgi:hypothetical protein
MYTGNIKTIIRIYKQFFDANNPDMRSKWHHVRHFQDEWNLDEADFAAMLTRSLPASRNASLLDNGSTYHPLANLKKMAGLEPERVRSLFRLLFDEAIDFDRDRVRFRRLIHQFQAGADQLYRALGLETTAGRLSDADDQAALFLLAMRFPDRFCFYRPESFRRLYQHAGVKYLGKSQTPTDKLCLYLVLWQMIRHEIKDDEELQGMARQAMAEMDYADPSFSLLALDVIDALSRDNVKKMLGDPLRYRDPRSRLMPDQENQLHLRLRFSSDLDVSEEDRLAKYLPVKLICDYEQRAVDMAGMEREVLPTSIYHGVTPGYDVLSYDHDGEKKFIILKVTEGDPEQEIVVNPYERRQILKHDGQNWIYYIHHFQPESREGRFVRIPIKR